LRRGSRSFSGRGSGRGTPATRRATGPSGR
jgi:hypothetical protein